MLPLIGLAVGAAGGIMGGIGQNAAAANRNKQAIQNWMQGEMQKGINNGKELFNASYAQQQQRERNAAIQRAAYLFEQDSLDAAKDQQTFVQNQISRSYRTMKGTMVAQAASSGISGGTMKALKLSQSMNFLNQVGQAEDNFAKTQKNIKRQAQNMMSQQRNDLILPNLQGASAKPILEEVGAGNIISGALGGIAGGLTSFGNLGGDASSFNAIPGIGGAISSFLGGD